MKIVADGLQNLFKEFKNKEKEGLKLKKIEDTEAYNQLCHLNNLV